MNSKEKENSKELLPLNDAAQHFLPPCFTSLLDKRPRPGTWEALVEEIRGDHHAAVTRLYRESCARQQAAEQAGDTSLADRLKAQRKALKDRQPAYIPSVTLKPDGRSAGDILSYSGYVMVDIDGIAPPLFAEALEKVRADRYGFLVHTTISGTGIRVIARADVAVTKENFPRVWHLVNDYYARLTGIAIDRQCKNATRMSVLCHDPEVLYRPDAPPLPVAKLLQEQTRKAAEAVRRQRPLGRPVTARRAAPTVQRLVEQEGVTYATGSHNDYICRCLYLMNRFGVSESDAQAWALAAFADYDATHHSVAATVRSCYGMTAEHGTWRLSQVARKTAQDSARSGDASGGGGCGGGSYGGNRNQKATVEEMEAFVKDWGEFRMNRLINQLEVSRHAALSKLSSPSLVPFERMTDQTENSLWRAMQHAGLETDVFRIRTLLMSDFVPDYHPLKEYLDSLEPWDGITDYIRQVSRMVHCRDTSEEEFDFYFRRWLVGLLAGALSDRVVNNVILVLLGPQGSFKSSFMSKLLPPELHRYYTVKTNSQRMTKDDAFAMTENLLINFEEIDSMQRAELNQLKALTTAEYVNERPAYGRNKVRLPHVASFCGTGNNLQFLTDDTGNRRWLPFEVERIDNPWTTTLPYAGMYAQALHLLRSGFRYWFDQQEVDALNDRNRRFEAPNPAKELILMYFKKPAALEKGKYYTATQIVARFGPAVRLNVVQVGRAMKELGFESVHTRNGRYWIVEERTANEMNSILPEPVTDVTDTF